LWVFCDDLNDPRSIAVPCGQELMFKAQFHFCLHQLFLVPDKTQSRIITLHALTSLAKFMMANPRTHMDINAEFIGTLMLTARLRKTLPPDLMTAAISGNYIVSPCIATCADPCCTVVLIALKGNTQLQTEVANTTHLLPHLARYLDEVSSVTEPLPAALVVAVRNHG
jgi:hypothetical protein